MSSSISELERWLSGGELMTPSNNLEDWEPGFDVDRQVVRTRVGGVYQKLFLRPDVFTKRFYHEVFPLSVDEWRYQETLELFDGFCLVDVDLELHFQATLKFVQRNAEALPDINSHIKLTFQRMLTDIIHKEVRTLHEGNWVRNGLTDIENKIAVRICELLMVQNIQSQALCRLRAEFQEFPEVQPGKDNVYLHVLKQSHEINEQKKQTHFEQHQAIKEMKLQQKQQDIEQLQKYAEIERQKRLQQAEQKLILLQDEERALSAQLTIEKRIEIEKIRHRQQLKEMEQEAELQSRQRIAKLEREAERLDLQESLEHQAELERQRIQADLEKRQKQQLHQAQVQYNKTQLDVENYEKQQEAWRDAKLRIHKQQLALKKRQKELESQAEEEYKRKGEEDSNPIVMPFQKLDKSEAAEKARRRSAALRNEIELSVLEKQRLELDEAIKAAEQNRMIEEES